MEIFSFIRVARQGRDSLCYLLEIYHELCPSVHKPPPPPAASIILITVISIGIIIILFYFILIMPQYHHHRHHHHDDDDDHHHHHHHLLSCFIKAPVDCICHHSVVASATIPVRRVWAPTVLGRQKVGKRVRTCLQLRKLAPIRSHRKDLMLLNTSCY